MKPYEQICAGIENPLNQVKEKVWQELGAVNAFAPEIGSYLQKMQGKYFRPVVVLLCAQMAGQDMKSSVVLAQAVETLHLATLIHDDVLDNASLRRNLETIHEKWGNRIAILVGDYLYSKTTQLLLQFQSFKVLDHIASVTVGFTKGELLQLFNQKKIQVTRQDYFKVIELKTANFMAVCAAFGGVLKGVYQKELYDFGYNLGMAFQISDDLLDWVGNPGEPAKPVQHDLSNGIISLPLLLVLEQATAAERSRFQTLMQNQDVELTVYSLQLIEKYRGPVLAQSYLDQYLGAAQKSLKKIKGNEFLVELLQYLSGRVPNPVKTR